MNANKHEDVRIQICWICQTDIFEFSMHLFVEEH